MSLPKIPPKLDAVAILIGKEYGPAYLTLFTVRHGFLQQGEPAWGITMERDEYNSIFVYKRDGTREELGVLT